MNVSPLQIPYQMMSDLGASQGTLAPCFDVISQPCLFKEGSFVRRSSAVQFSVVYH